MEGKKERKAEYIEHVYDLIFVYIIGRNISLLHNVSGGFVEQSTFINYIICTLAVIQMWTLTMFYINVHGRSSARDHVMLFVNMFLLYFVGEGTRADWQGYHGQYHIAWALILVNIAVQYLLELRNHKEEPEQKKSLVNMAVIILAETVPIIGAVFEFKYYGTSFLSMIAVVSCIVIIGVYGKISTAHTIDFVHFSERLMLYVVFTFGEMIIVIAGFFEGDATLSNLFFPGMAFLMVVGLFLSYGFMYDKLLDKEKEVSGVSYMMSHIFIIFSLNSITMSLEFMKMEEIAVIPKTLFLVTAVIFFHFCLISTKSYLKETCVPSKQFYFMTVLAAAVYTGLVLVFRENIYIVLTSTVLFVFIMCGTLYSVNKRSIQ